MNFENDLDSIAFILDELEAKWADDKISDISKMQIFVQGYLPGLVYRMREKDNNLHQDIDRIYKLFFNTFYCDKDLSNLKHEDTKKVVNSINELFKIMSDTTS